MLLNIFSKLSFLLINRYLNYLISWYLGTDDDRQHFYVDLKARIKNTRYDFNRLVGRQYGMFGPIKRHKYK